ALSVPTYAVRSLQTSAGTRIGFAEAGAARRFLIYAERAVPPDGRTPSDRDSAFADLDYATYLGRSTARDALVTTNLPLSKLPMTRDEYRTELAFGDSQLTLVATSRRHLGGSLSEHLPLILLLGGLLLTALAARLVFQVVRGRQSAESDASTISSLYERVDAMYAEQREVSVRLQRALLPPSNPEIPGLAVASEYVAGAQGVDIGGDWYSIVRLDEEHFAFVVGDVSGHGIDAVAVMARARFTLRAYLLDGNPPDVALAKCSLQFDISADGHMATVLVGVGDSRTGDITLANAGHPPPVVITADGTGTLVRVPVGPPLGTGQGSYTTSTVNLPSGATLVGYTDGLVERRGEDIEVSLDRLVATAEQLPRERLHAFVSSLLDAMADVGQDDIAVLALKRD
ncbi:MAG: serine/threonine-protein phosphatase, partial [Microbacterium sp.]